MKIAINKCFGGFSLSAKGMKEYYELKEIKCFFFKDEGTFDNKTYEPILITEAQWYFTAFSIENPNDVDTKTLWDKYYLTCTPEDRADTDLISVIEQLKGEANGSCADLKVVEIPDGTDYYIHEYDGNETINENHKSWS